MNTNRKFIGIELDEGYFKIANGRIVDAYNKAQETSWQPYIYALNFNHQLTKGNKMLYFSSMTAEEFLNANQQEIPEQVINCFKEFKEKISELESKLEVLSKSEELAWEQVSFARDLIEQLDNFSENELSKPKQKMYNLIRENSYFEV